MLFYYHYFYFDIIIIFYYHYHQVKDPKEQTVPAQTPSKTIYLCYIPGT